MSTPSVASRFVALLRHAFAIVVLPGTVTGVIPYLILRARPLRPSVLGPMGQLGAQVFGGALIACGLALAIATIRQFATTGRGTLAPWDPPRHLVVRGAYRYVRNPMIAGVLLVLLGEALAFRALGVLIWFAAFAALNAAFIPLVEERMLERRFGDEYRQYRRSVPRWFPRRTPWTPPWDA